ncbi:CARDB domain-containing protein [Polaromonas sp. A23]|uniref:CARDB domain-containing protein n=1 Tax=Polaromonas sp. A23 TaxID=1944133 RepID=UPI00111597D1|nr:CARDB domain-containing protein [Polaromonas sp. A23]
MQSIFLLKKSAVSHTVPVALAFLFGVGCMPAVHAANQAGAQQLKPCPPGTPSTIGDCDRRYAAPGEPAKAAVSPAANLPLKAPGLPPPPTVPPPGGNTAAPVDPNAAESLQANGLPDLFIYRFYKTPQEAGLPAGFPLVEFCGSNDGLGGPSRRVYFEVHNRGSVPSPNSKVSVRFVNPNTQQMQTVNVSVKPLKAHSHVAKKVTIPQGCYSAGSNALCNFTITADPDAQIAERFENNNAQRAFCVGPTN